MSVDSSSDHWSQLNRIVGMAMTVLPEELGCDDCFEFLAAFAEHILNGTAMPESLRAVAEHLDRCPACLEEMRILVQAISAQGTPVESMQNAG